jgi:hypothetical protein
MAINDYFTVSHWWLFYRWLLMVINGYCIISYCWLLSSYIISLGGRPFHPSVHHPSWKFLILEKKDDGTGGRR